MTTLTDKDRVNLEVLLGHLHDDIKASQVNKGNFVACMAHLITVVAQNNRDEIELYTQQGRKLFRRSEKSEGLR